MQSNTSTIEKRVVFIDLLRAYAILMMVQGHFIEVTLASQYQSTANFIYLVWATLRGMTAPLFFFASGTIFTYLLFKFEKNNEPNPRIKKGLKRFLMLVGLGYLLRLQPTVFYDFFDLKSPEIMPFWAIDTLHCIGFGLFFIIILYQLSKITKINSGILFALFAFLIFIISPIVENSNAIMNLPIPIANFFTYKYGSNFPIIPWNGFVLWGALLGFLLNKKHISPKSYLFIFSLSFIGLFLIFFSGDYLAFLYKLTGIEVFRDLFMKNILFLHLGNVLFASGIFAFFASYFKIPKLLTKVGNHTLMIYIVHIFIIYGTAFTPGIQTWFSKSLNPYQSITYAIILIAFFLLIVKYYENIADTLKFFKNSGNKIIN